jgi:dihydroceramidase
MDFMAFSLIGVGVCSFAFHATMRQIPQYSDDLSMLLLAGALLHPVYAANGTPAVRRLIAVTLIAIIGSVAVIYVRDGNLLIHTFAFIALITFLWPRTLWLVYHTGSSKEERRRMMGHFTWAAVSIIVGFALWNVDLEYCFDLRAAREWLGTPLAWVLELHGWWHILTALAASHFIRLIRMVTDVKTHKG